MKRREAHGCRGTNSAAHLQRCHHTSSTCSCARRSTPPLVTRRLPTRYILPAIKAPKLTSRYSPTLRARHSSRCRRAPRAQRQSHATQSPSATLLFSSPACSSSRARMASAAWRRRPRSSAWAACCRARAAARGGSWTLRCGASTCCKGAKRMQLGCNGAQRRAAPLPRQS